MIVVSWWAESIAVWLRRGTIKYVDDVKKDASGRSSISGYSMERLAMTASIALIRADVQLSA